MTPAIWTGMYAELPLPKALRVLHACGWRVFEVSSEHLVDIETSEKPEHLIAEIRECLHEQGLSARQAHALLRANLATPDGHDRERDIQRLLRHVEIAACLGVSHIVMHPGGYSPSSELPRRKVRDFNIAAFRRLGDATGAHGMQIGLENLPYPGIASAFEMLDLVHAIDHPAIRITLDTSHANMGSLDIAEMIHSLGDYLVATHISDNNGLGDQHLAPGGGSIDWNSVMKAFRKIDYKGVLNLEIPGERHRILELRRLKTCFALEVAEWLIAIMDGDTDASPTFAEIRAKTKFSTNFVS